MLKMSKSRIFLIAAITALIFVVINASGADKKISDFVTLGQASWSTSDLIPIVDVSAGATKQTTIGDFDARYFNEADTLAVPHGGTGLTSGTATGIPYFATSTTMASTLAGSQYQVFRMGASTPAWGQINLDQAAAVTGILPNANTTATSSNSASAIVARNASGDFTAGSITANLIGNVTGNLTGAVTGNASTATALAANPSDCGADTYATTIAASGNLTCATVTNAGLAGSIAASKLIGSDIATVGTVTSGTWSATTIALNKGGTGQTTKAAAFDALSPMTASGDLIYGGVSGTGTALPKGSDGQVLTLASGLPSWATAGGSSSAVVNLLTNAAFDWWQYGTTTNIANTVSNYRADQWYVKNSLGTNGVITYSQVSGVTNGSKYGASVKITTAPTAAQTNGTELYQVIENPNTIPLLGQSLSASALVKAYGNVNQVGIAFVYNTTEAKPTTVLGAESTFSVNSATFTLGSVVNQAVSTTPTTSGVVGIRIRITGVSSGNTYDLNNGFIVEQAMANIGSTAGTFARATNSAQEELARCQRYYEKSWEPATDPATNTTTGVVQMWGATSANTMGVPTFYAVTKRAVPTLVVYDKTGAPNKCSNAGGDGQTVVIQTGAGSHGFTATCTTSGNDRVLIHYTADASI
jgi:hypothetical protein